MTELTIAAAAAPFGRDMDLCLHTIEDLIGHARRQGAGLLVLPEAALGGYVETLHGDADPPPALGSPSWPARWSSASASARKGKAARSTTSPRAFPAKASTACIARSTCRSTSTA